jgi:TonB family protein
MCTRNPFLPSGALFITGAVLIAFGAAHAQAPAPSTAVPAQSPAASPPPLVLSAPEQPGGVSLNEEDLRRQLQGKTFYLRSGYLGDSLHFNETGALDGNAPAASYTLSLVEIERVRLEKHRLELECVRYGVHFLGALATEDQTQAVDRVRLTSKKKPLKITIDREEVSKQKKVKEAKPGKDRHARAPGSQSLGSPLPAPDAMDGAPAPGSAHPASDARRRRASTTSQAEADGALAKAIDHVFASAIDERMIATLPEYWRLFYQSAAAHQLFKPADPSILRQADVNQKAKLVSMLEPQSNEYAQKNGVAGMAMYSVVVGSDGKPQQIAVGRPIGFGLDENAVDSIRKATFQPAIKDGKPVPVLLDVLVQFRIYSKLTATESLPSAKTRTQPEAPALPGPYTANMPRPQTQPVADTAQQAAPAAESAPPASQPASPEIQPMPATATQPAPAPSQQPATAPPPGNTPQ